MIRIFRFSPSRLALSYIALSVLVLALFAVPLWYAWNVNISTFRTYIHAEEMQRLTDLFDKEGAKGLAAAIGATAASLPRDEVVLFADPSKARLAGNLPAWPAEVPDAPGTHGLALELGDSSMRVVVSHVKLPGGYHLLVGRESARFQSLVDFFWYGIAGAMGVVLVLGAAVGWMIRRALLSEVNEIGRTASAIVEGDLSRRLATRGGSKELDTLASTVNGMLERLARQNVQLEGEIDVRRQAEQALHRAHDDLEGLVAQRTAQVARANESLDGEKRLLELIAKGNPLPATLDALCRYVEETSGGILCSILLLDSGGGRMRHGAAPSLPESYIAAIDRWPLNAGPCGMAASLGEPVIASDIAADERWHEYQALARAYGIRACWSTPITSSDGKVLGTFAMLSREPGSPAPQHLDTIEQVTHIASIAIERTRAEAALRARQEMLDLAQKAARALAFEWRIGAGEGENRWSPDLEAMYGLPPGSYDGTFDAWRKLVHSEDWPAVQEAIGRANESGDVDAEYRVVHPAGVVRWLQAKGRILSDGRGQPERIVGFMLDVTARRQAEEDLRRLEHQLRRAQRLEAIGTLAGGIAHDFNNILGAILGYGEMALRDAPPGSRLRRDLESITAAGERGRALVDRILAFSRSGVGERVAVQVEKVVRESLDLLMANLPAGITVKAELHAGRAAMRGDATQVHQVFMNLSTNGVQAMEPGGTLRVSLGTVRLDSQRIATTGAIAAGNYILLKVADSGRGIPREILDRIFDPFFTTKEVGVGTGLGLSLVHGIVTEVGGAIDVETTVGAGSTFVVYLPHDGDAVDGFADEQPDLPRGGQQRILVVDDEEPLVRLATETLQELGYVPVGFTSSTDALEAFRADPRRFDAVIADERMPGMSGSALIREMRGMRRSIPILLVSGYVGGMVAGRAFNAGANEVLKKPLSARELATSLARVLHLQ